MSLLLLLLPLLPLLLILFYLVRLLYGLLRVLSTAATSLSVLGIIVYPVEWSQRGLNLVGCLLFAELLRSLGRSYLLLRFEILLVHAHALRHNPWPIILIVDDPLLVPRYVFLAYLKLLAELQKDKDLHLVVLLHDIGEGRGGR